MGIKKLSRRIDVLARRGLTGEQIASLVGGQVEVFAGCIYAIRRGRHTIRNPHIPRIGS